MTIDSGCKLTAVSFGKTEYVYRSQNRHYIFWHYFPNEYETKRPIEYFQLGLGIGFLSVKCL